MGIYVDVAVVDSSEFYMHVYYSRDYRQRHGTIPTERQKNRKKKVVDAACSGGTIETIERNSRYLLRRTNVATAVYILVRSFGKERRREKNRADEVDTIHERQSSPSAHT